MTRLSTLSPSLPFPLSSSLTPWLSSPPQPLANGSSFSSSFLLLCLLSVKNRTERDEKEGKGEKKIKREGDRWTASVEHEAPYFWCAVWFRREEYVLSSGSAVWLKALSERLEEDDLAVTGNSFNITIRFTIYIQHTVFKAAAS